MSARNLMFAVATTSAVIAGGVDVQARADVAADAVAGDAMRGRELFLGVGCYQCHGTWGKGSGVAPALTPDPVPFAAFENQLRHPVGVMPVYTGRVLSRQQVQDIYVYLSRISHGPPAAAIALLAPRP